MFLVVKYSVNDAPFLVGFAVKAGSHVQRKYKHKKRTFEPGRRKQKRKGTISIFFCLRRYVIRVNRDNASKGIAQAHAPAQKKINIFCQRINKQLYPVRSRRRPAHVLCLCLRRTCEPLLILRHEVRLTKRLSLSFLITKL